MNAPKWLVIASIVNLAGNAIGIVLALQNNLMSDLGGSIQGQDVHRDFLTTRGTALSAPVPFMLIQLVLTLLVLRSGRWRLTGSAGLTFFGMLYTLAQAGERITLRLLTPAGFDSVQALALVVNEASAIAMLVLGILAWKSLRAPRRVVTESP